MDLSTSHFNAFHEAGRLEPAAMYPSFAAPTPINLSKGYHGNTLTPGAIPSPLNFPSITPPRSPYSFYGFYSPSSTSSVSPMYDPTYLKRLKSNPMFRDLQTLLRQECLQMQVPANLITTSWNLMELHKATPTNGQAHPTSCELTNRNSSSTSMPASSWGSTSQSGSANSGQQVYMCHMKLQDKLLKVRIDPAVSADGLSVENDYSKEVGNTEMERYRALHSCPDQHVKTTINSYYDKQRLHLADKTEAKLDKLIEKAEEIRRSVQINKNVCTEPKNNVHQSKEILPETKEGASLLLAPVEDKMNAVRKLKFNMSDDNVNVHDDNDEDNDDYLNCSVNSEDFEIDDIDVETIDNKQNNTKMAINKVTNSSGDSERCDLLKQCIEQSGLNSLKNEKLPEITFPSVNNRDNSADILSDLSASESILPDSSTSDSPISMNSPTDSTNQSSSTNSSMVETTNTSFIQEEFKNKVFNPEQFDFTQYFSTPQNGHLKYTHPDHLNSALSEMQKMCSGPTVNFTPELRRDFIHANTPEVSKLSPLNEQSYNMNGHHTNPYCQNVNTNSVKDLKVQPRNEQYMSCDNRNNNVNMNLDSAVSSNTVSTATSQKNGDDFKFENTPVFRTHRMLNAETTNILSQWYQAHVQYPYPNDEEVEALSKATGITGRQVKKWMANKRVRCFNTLSITGNQHPIKHKYQGKGRKRKAPADEKENCDSTSNEKRGNYSMLNDAAKNVLNQWYEDHVTNPYPSEEEKLLLAQHCGITVGQVKSWFANKRNRSNNTKRQIPNYFIEKFPEYSQIVQMVGQKREEERMLKRRKVNDYMYIQPPFYI